MKKTIVCLTVLACMVLFLADCKKSQETEKMTLTVQSTAGVGGTPPAGTYEYDMNATVPFSYSAVAGYENIQARLDGQPVAASGTIAMNVDHTLSTTASRILYFQGNWRVDIVWTSQTCALQSEYGLAAVGTQNGDDVTFVVTTPTLPAPVNCTGKIDLQGNFDLAAEVDHGGGIVMKYRIKGRMISRDALTATVDAEGYYQGNLTCTATGDMSGTRQ